MLKERVLSKRKSYSMAFDERIRDVQIGPGGYIYVLTDNKNGKLFRITRAKR